jgi:hypothetical protein
LLKVGVRLPDGVVAPEVIATDEADTWPLELNGTEVYFAKTCDTACEADSLYPAPAGQHWVQYRSTSLINSPAGPDSVTFGIAIRWTQPPPRRSVVGLWLSDDSDDRYGETVTDALVQWVYTKPRLRTTPQKRWSFTEIAPNPFNPVTTISYSVAEEGWIELSVFRVDGSLARRLVSETQPADEYRVRWDGTDDRGVRVASGIYFCRLRGPGFDATRKMLLLK